MKYANAAGLVWDDSALSLRVLDRLGSILRVWEGTPYGSGQSCAGAASDCIGFVFGALDDLYRKEPHVRVPLPSDASMHNPDSARATMRELLRMYPNDPVTNGIIEPGDVLVTGVPNGGPGHAMLVGDLKSSLWHCNIRGKVCYTGLGFATDFQVVAGIYRPRQKELWSW